MRQKCSSKNKRLTRPNEPDAKATREVGDTGEEVALGNVLAGGLPLLLVLGIPGGQLDLGEDPALRLLDALDFGLLVLHDLLGIVGLDVGGLGGTDDGLAAADEGVGLLVVVCSHDEINAGLEFA